MKIVFVSVLMALGGIAFAQLLSPPIEILRPGIDNIALAEYGDFDGDGQNDIVYSVRSGGNSRIEYRLGNGRGGFGPAVVLPGRRLPGEEFFWSDLDRDGNEELIVTTGFPEVVVYEWRSGRFRIRQTIGFPSPRLVEFSAVGDLNNDGFDDFLYMQRRSGIFNLYYRLNDGEGDLRGEILLRGEQPVAFFVIDDVDGDGLNDIMACDFDRGATGYFQGLGQGDFAAYRNLAPGRSDRRYFEAGDVDNDGDPDYLLVSPSAYYLYQNDGRGNFTDRRLFSYSSFTGTHIRLGDFNGDGFLDIFYGGGNGSFVRENRNGSVFGPEEDLARGDILSLDTIRVFDWDRDGNDDLMVQLRSSFYYHRSLTPSPPVISSFAINDNTVSANEFVTLTWDVSNADEVRINGLVVTGGSTSRQVGEEDTVFTLTATNGGGSVTSEVTAFVPEPLFQRERSLAGGEVGDLSQVQSGDLDGDGLADLIYLNGSDGVVGWLRNEGGGSFANPVELSRSLNDPRSFCLFDPDGDGDLDIAVISRSPLQWFRNDGSGDFVTGLLIGNDRGTAVAGGDLDQDGFDDLVFSRFEAVGTFGVILYGDGQGGFGRPDNLEIGRADALELVDLDGDGILDIVWSSETESGFRLGSASGEFHERSPTEFATPPVLDPLVGDFDGDGLVDVVGTTTVDPALLRLYRGAGDGAFGQGEEFDEFEELVGQAAGDVDQDGDLDVVVIERAGNPSAGRIFLMENDGRGAFSDPQLVTDGIDGASLLEVVDLNGDLFPELVVGPPESGLFWLRNFAGNQPPVAEEDVSGSVDEDTPELRIKLSNLITDEEDPVLQFVVTASEVPAGLFDRSEIEGDELVLGPAADAFGTASFTVTGRDSGDLEASSVITIEVLPVNDRPVVLQEMINRTVDEDSLEIRVNLAELITDKEDPVLKFSVSAEEVPAGLFSRRAVEGDEFVLVPAANAFGAASFTVTGRDSEGLEADSVITIDILPVNDPPTVSVIPPVDGPADGASISRDLAAFFNDVDPGDRLTFAVRETSNPDLFSEVTLDPETGMLVIDFADYVSGTATLAVRAVDQEGLAVETDLEISLPEIPQPSLVVESEPQLNRRSGLLEQGVTVTNVGARAIRGFAITATMENEASLYNATRDLGESRWLVEHDVPVAAGEAVRVILEYYVRSRRLAGAPSLEVAHSLPLPVRPVPDEDGVTIDRVTRIGVEAVMLEFASEPGALYRVQYSDDGTTWRNSLVRLRAGGTRVQWVDRGSPKTSGPPVEPESRFYRVVEAGVDDD